VLREHPSQKSQQIASLIQGKAFARLTHKLFLKANKNTQAHSHTRAQADEGACSWWRSEGGCLQIDKVRFRKFVFENNGCLVRVKNSCSLKYFMPKQQLQIPTILSLYSFC